MLGHLPPATCLINTPLLPPEGEPSTHKKNMYCQAPFSTPPWPALNKLTWNIYCSLLKLKNQSLEDYGIFQKSWHWLLDLLQAPQSGAASGAGHGPVGPASAPEGPWVVLRPWGLRWCCCLPYLRFPPALCWALGGLLDGWQARRE